MNPGPTHEAEPVFLVEGPKWNDAEFFGQWMLAAAKANELWKEIYKDPSFKTYVDRQTVCYAPDFGCAAAIFLLLRLEQRSGYFVVGLYSEEAELFAVMAVLGFFKREGSKHQMAIPSMLTIQKVKGAFVELAKTEDKDCALHPEYLVATMPLPDAEAYQRRQIALDEFQRNATSKPIGSESVVH